MDGKSDNEVIVEAVIRNCISTMLKSASEDRTEEELNRILEELSMDYPFLDSISINEGRIIIKDPGKVASVNKISIARSMNCVIHKSILYSGGFSDLVFRQRISQDVGSDLNLRIRDAGVCL